MEASNDLVYETLLQHIMLSNYGDTPGLLTPGQDSVEIKKYGDKYYTVTIIITML